jgi:predicted RND superfamily exporter protein
MATARVDKTAMWIKVTECLLLFIWAGLLIGGVFVGAFTTRTNVFGLMLVFGVICALVDMILFLIHATRYIEDNRQAFAEEEAEKAAAKQQT